MRTPHTSCPRGKRVRIKLRSGEVLYGKFKERTANYVVLEEQMIWAGDVQSFTIARPIKKRTIQTPELLRKMVAAVNEAAKSGTLPKVH